MAAADDAAASMRAAVKRLSFGVTAEERRQAAGEAARLARSDERRKRLLPELGVVPPLLSMLADGRAADSGARLAAAEALHELARGTHRNKVHIVKAGLLKKLPRLMDDEDLSRSQHLAHLLLSISSLVNTDFPLSSSELLPFLVAALSAADVTPDTKLSYLAALRNLSTKLEHARAVVSSGAVRALVALSLDKKATTWEAALSALADLASSASAAARKAMAEDDAAPRALVEAMTRHERARCQEHAAYLVMVLAHDGGAAGDAPARRRAGAARGVAAGQPARAEEGGQGAAVVQGRRRAERDQGALGPAHGGRRRRVVPWRRRRRRRRGAGLPERRGQDSEAES